MIIQCWVLERSFAMVVYLELEIYYEHREVDFILAAGAQKCILWFSPFA